MTNDLIIFNIDIKSGSKMPNVGAKVSITSIPFNFIDQQFVIYKTKKVKPFSF